MTLRPVAPDHTTQTFAFVSRSDDSAPYGISGGVEDVTTRTYPPTPHMAALRHLRVAYGLTLGDTARLLGCSVVDVSGMERGALEPDAWGDVFRAVIAAGEAKP